ncbi:MAG: hypothetical protein HDS42_05665 [Bacteroides sp.]|nr:hypothetical protein [Bacteroides sp.]
MVHRGAKLAKNLLFIIFHIQQISVGVLDNYADRIPFFGACQQNLAVIVSKICTLYNLGDERLQFERLVATKALSR